jgi:hypothetical protein
MISYKYFFAFFFVCFVLHSMTVTKLHAQNFPQDYWHEGEVTLFDEQNFQGRIKYNLEKDNVQVTLASNGSVKTYSSRNVESFEFIDAVIRIKRSFFTLPFQKTNGYESPMFFELLTDGDIALLNRETVILRQMPVYMYGGMAPAFTNVPVLIDNFYFLLKKEQKVIKFNDKKEMLLELLSAKHDKVQAYLSNNKVDVSKREDLMKLIDYYNSVQK